MALQGLIFGYFTLCFSIHGCWEKVLYSDYWNKMCFFLQYCYNIDHWACSSIGSISFLSLNLDICLVSTGKSSFHFSFSNHGALNISTRQREPYQVYIYILVLYNPHQIQQKLFKMNIPLVKLNRSWLILHPCIMYTEMKLNRKWTAYVMGTHKKRPGRREYSHTHFSLVVFVVLWCGSRVVSWCPGVWGSRLCCSWLLWRLHSTR